MNWLLLLVFGSYMTCNNLLVTMHRQTRKFMQRIIKPGIKLFDMCETLEETARSLVEANGLTAGELQLLSLC